MVIMVILASLVVPRLHPNTDREANASAEKMVLLINQAREEAVMSSRVWQVIFDPGEQSYRFMQYAGNEFIEVTLPPFAGNQHLTHVSLNQLEINGEPRADTGEIYLFPTGEQDAFRLIIQGEQQQFVVVMGPVGEAGVEKL